MANARIRLKHFIRFSWPDENDLCLGITLFQQRPATHAGHRDIRAERNPRKHVHAIDRGPAPRAAVSFCAGVE